MGLIKYRIGDLIKIVDEKNNLGIRNFCGINKAKEFMPTVANTANLDESKYKVVRKNRFVFSGMQTGRDQSIRLVMYTKDEPIIVSPAYTTFEIKATNIVLPLYFFMIFLSEEKDRLGWFLSDSSVRANLDWDVFCDIELNLPPLDIQKKYVDLYKALLANQEVYEEGLEDLRLVCDGTIEKLKHEDIYREIGEFIKDVNVRNENESVTLAQGVNVDKVFMPSKRVAANIKNTKIVKEGQFAYNKVMKANGTLLPIALRKGPTCFVSSSYQVFEVVKPDELNAEYLMLWLTRMETQRYAGYISWGSTRDSISFETFCEILIPVPDIKIQEAIANMYNSYITRSEINEKLKRRIKNMCPILIKGAMEEASRGEA